VETFIKINVRDLHWVAKQTSKFPYKCAKAAKKKIKADISCISLADNRLVDITQLVLTWVGRPNSETLRRLACKKQKEKNDELNEDVAINSCLVTKDDTPS